MNIFDDPRLVKVTDNIWQVSGEQKGQFPYCHSFLFTGSGNILIDAGADEELIRRIDSTIGIDTLVISHSHPDHIRRWYVLSHRRLMLPVETPDAVFNIESLGERFTGSRENGLHWARVIGGSLELKALREPDGRYMNGHVFDNGTSRIEAIHQPGHLDDHYCFFEHNSRTLFTTDIDFTSFGPWYGNPEGKIAPFKDGIHSIMKLPYNRVCTSHKPPHEGDATDKFNLFLAAFDRQEKLVYDTIGSGKSLAEIAQVSPFYRDRFYDKRLQYVFEENMAAENLAVLMEKKLVYERDGTYYKASM